MSMYGVNASIPKTLVRHIVQYYGDTCTSDTLRDVLYDILDTPVSPELLPTDESGTEMTQKTEDLVDYMSFMTSSFTMAYAGALSRQR